MGRKDFASYEKEVKSKIVEITHTVRFRINTLAGDARNIINHVPTNAKIINWSSDDSGEFVEIVFLEEREE
ncbi:hypothetical protein AYK24_00070 [Thermoplasmatales archaeon SG8-52-4]|nr:MAG: hypothetical protein AYK24_00070 [Thermoplasmatales archaeon SG8-52-4]